MRSRTAFLLLLLLVPYGTARGGLGVHDVTPATRFPEGPCGECHFAHAAGRKWASPAVDTPTTGWYTQEISLVCVSCHSPGNSFGAKDATTTALHSQNHGFSIANAPAAVKDPTTREIGATLESQLPLLAKERLQCTTCHNPHSDEFRPYLRTATIGELCDTCHPGRRAGFIRAGNVGTGDDNASVHPVGIPIADMTGTGQAGIKPPATVPPELRTPIRPPPDYALGGKLSNGAAGVISCETCHAIHGTVSRSGIMSLLAVDNRSQDLEAGGSPLCASCHYGGAGGGSVGAPGTTDHPVDNVTGRPFYPKGVALPGAWMTGRIDRPAAFFAATAAGRGTPRCSSCHDAHGGLGRTSILRGPVTSAGGGAWCWSCHSVSQVAPRLHHSSRSTYDFSVIECGDCHGNRAVNQAQWSAHNGFADFAVGPDTNAATPQEDAAATLYNTEPNSRTFERLCESCHQADNPTTFASGRNFGNRAVFPARHGNFTGTQSHLASHFTAKGSAIYIQDANRTYNSFLRAGRSGTNHWGKVSSEAGAYAEAEIFSKYANYGPTGTPQNPQVLVNGAYLICESCHNLLTNAGKPRTLGDTAGGYLANLLVYRYEDDGSGIRNGTGPAAVGDGLCRGCHASSMIAWTDLDNPSPAASYVHYPEAHTANPSLFMYPMGIAPYGRPTRTLLTAYDKAACPETTSADAEGAPGVFSYPNVNRLDCDSCHRPHNAAQQGDNGLDFTFSNAATVGLYILEPGSVATRNAAKSETCLQCHDPQKMCGY